MAKVSVAYEKQGRKAIINCDSRCAGWARIKRVCLEASDAAEFTELQIVVPWWAFVNCQQSINYHISRHNITLEISKSAEKQIQRATDQRAAYYTAAEALPINDTDIIGHLRKANFSEARHLSKEQTRNIGRLASMPSGASFSVPGAGKTTEALAYYSIKRHPGTRLLVVAPKNAFAAWEEQLSDCLPEEPDQFVRLRGGLSAIKSLIMDRPKFMLITYHQLPNVLELITDYLEAEDVIVFLDESHKIKKGESGILGNSVLSLSGFPKHKLILSGTPMPNDKSDLVPQFRFLFPEITAHDENVIDLFEPVFVRTKKDELGLPDVHYVIQPIPLLPAQRAYYDLLCSELARDLRPELRLKDKVRMAKAGRSALRLIRLVSNPALLLSMNLDQTDLLSQVAEEGDGNKIAYACLKARALASENKKTIIWSSFLANIELISDRLSDIGADYIHGGVETKTDDEEDSREWKIKQFHENPSAMVLVANPAACGEGISLHTVCHHAIYLDRTYNAAQYMQSVDRIHRFGSTHEKTVEILVSPDTVDVSVNDRLEKKIGQMADALNDGSIKQSPIKLDADSTKLDDDDLGDFLRHIYGQKGS